MIEATVGATWKAPRATGLQANTLAVTETAVTEHLLALAASNDASKEAKAIARAEAISLRDWIASASAASPEDKALNAATMARIDQFLKDPEKFTPAPMPTVPPGQPIGDDE